MAVPLSYDHVRLLRLRAQRLALPPSDQITSTLRQKNFHDLCHQSLSLVGPFERLGHRLVIIVDESQDPGL